MIVYFFLLLFCNAHITNFYATDGDGNQYDFETPFDNTTFGLQNTYTLVVPTSVDAIFCHYDNTFAQDLVFLWQLNTTGGTDAFLWVWFAWQVSRDIAIQDGSQTFYFYEENDENIRYYFNVISQDVAVTDEPTTEEPTTEFVTSAVGVAVDSQRDIEINLVPYILSIDPAAVQPFDVKLKVTQSVVGFNDQETFFDTSTGDPCVIAHTVTQGSNIETGQINCPLIPVSTYFLTAYIPSTGTSVITSFFSPQAPAFPSPTRDPTSSTREPTPVPTSTPEPTPPLATPSPTIATTQDAAPTNPVPDPKPEVTVCADINAIMVQLVTTEQQNTPGNQNCTDLASDINQDVTLSYDDMCPCFLANDLNYLTQHYCRPNDPTQYTIRDTAIYCFGEDPTAGPTDTSLIFNHTLAPPNFTDISTWTGADPDGLIHAGEKVRQTYIGDDMDPVDDMDASEYMLIEFDSTVYGNWEQGDEIQVMIDDVVVYKFPAAGNFGTTDGQDDSHAFVLPFKNFFGEPNGNAREFTIAFTSTLGGTDEYFEVTPTLFQTMTRYDLALYCQPYNSYNESIQHPVFLQEPSGFRWNYIGPHRATFDSDRLHLEATVPRFLYDFTIDFTNGTATSAYDRSRDYTLAETINPSTETYWTSNLLTDEDVTVSTQPEYVCGGENWYADIPWDVFYHPENAGGVSLFNVTNNGTHTEFSDDWYKFGSTIEFAGWEPVTVEGGGRTWNTVRNSLWRVPFLIRFQRIVYVETEVEVILCPTPAEDPPHAFCTLTYVGALVRHVQANTLYNLDTRSYRADVNLDIMTKVMYPHMFVTGTKADDPPVYWETYNQTHHYQPPLDGSVWSPPTVDYAPTIPGTDVDIVMSFVSEDEASCTFINHNDISLNDGRECTQNWHMYIQPKDGVCYIDGQYTVTWAARCFYDKPVCTFNDDENGNRLNTAAIVFDVHSTNMCPELVHEVDVYGQICSTGRYEYRDCDSFDHDYFNTDDYVPADIESPLHYFQNDEVYFALEVESDAAVIIYTRIMEIWTHQDYSTWDNSSTSLDSDYDQRTRLWDASNPTATHEFTSSVTGLTSIINNVMVGVDDSTAMRENHGFPGLAGPNGPGKYAGFRVKLDHNIFPAPRDSWQDVNFEVLVEVTYEGNRAPMSEKPVRRALQDGKLQQPEDRSQPMRGQKTEWLNTAIQCQRQKIKTTDCHENNPHSFWSLEITLTEAQMAQYEENLDTVLNAEMFKITESNHVSLLGVTRHATKENSFVAVYSVEDSSEWDPMTNVFLSGNRLLFSKSQFFYQATTSSIHCMDAPLGTSLEAVAECAQGQPCSFYDGKTLEEHSGPSLRAEDADSGSSALAVTLLFALVAALW